jgi:hypothetical protein
MLVWIWGVYVDATALCSHRVDASMGKSIKYVDITAEEFKETNASLDISALALYVSDAVNSGSVSHTDLTSL